MTIPPDAGMFLRDCRYLVDAFDELPGVGDDLKTTGDVCDLVSDGGCVTRLQNR
ncbi:hypothetical protein P3H15_41460 [Rhodococcus sp. T2V]|uniref:hypothetical protein n=1 Tax=Rhodococcus sp. T2V TaxID=3034164 RepID=UPI0023E24BFB|nr:hypothetical protein [Rhodococcus sp. T2V]MDF3311458.1 hypothetical protein [Rhodococcus sp. T2V]